MEKKLFFISVFVFTFICFFTGLSYAEGRVGYIDLKRLVNESDMGKAAKTNLVKLKEERESDLKEKLKEIEELKSDIDKSSDALDSDEVRINNQKLNRLVKEYKRLEEDAKEDLAIGDRELVADILKEANDALKKVAKKKKYTIILKDPNVLGYLDPDVDITDAVLKELNK